jgi:hypothetical protein
MHGNWEYFINNLLQVEYEYRCFSKKLSSWRMSAQISEIVLAICTPSSAIGMFFSDSSFWKVALLFASVLAIIRPIVITPTIKTLERMQKALSDSLCSFRVTLDDAHYENTDSKAWLAKAKRVTSAYKAIVLDPTSFSLATQRAAQDETLSVYCVYLKEENSEQYEHQLQ